MEWEKYLQTVYQMKGKYPKYIKNSYYSITITTTTTKATTKQSYLKVGRVLE